VVWIWTSSFLGALFTLLQIMYLLLWFPGCNGIHCSNWVELLYLVPFSVTEHKEQNYGKSELLKHMKNKNPCTLLLVSVDILIVVNPLTSLSSNTYRYTLYPCVSVVCDFPICMM
jgi:hypothetical protein